MDDMEKKIIIGGLLIFLITALFPFIWSNLGENPLPSAMVENSSEEPCILPSTFMRSSHMQLLDEWRDDVVRRGDRQFVSSDGRVFEKSLSKTCMECHSMQQCENCHQSLNVHTYCWDCHVLPDMSSRYARLYSKLRNAPFPSDPQANDFYAINFKAVHAQKESVDSSERGDGQLMPGAQVQLLAIHADALHVRIPGWQQDQARRVIYAMQGRRIFSAVLSPALTEQIQVIESMVDPDTDLTWHRVELKVWLKKADLISSRAPLWEFAKEIYSNSCTACHTGSKPEHHFANQWLGHLKSMKRFVSLDRVQYYSLLNYLQFHAKDVVLNEREMDVKDSIKHYP